MKRLVLRLYLIKDADKGGIHQVVSNIGEVVSADRIEAGQRGHDRSHGSKHYIRGERVLHLCMDRPV
jgi:hypothetical protein